MTNITININDFYDKPKRYGRNNLPPVGSTVIFDPNDSRVLFCYPHLVIGATGVVYPAPKEFTESQNIVYVRFTGIEQTDVISPEFLASPRTIKEQWQKPESKAVIKHLLDKCALPRELADTLSAIYNNTIFTGVA